MDRRARDTFPPRDSQTKLLASERKSSQPSMLYSMLPAAVQTRIPTLPSLRRSVSDFRGRNAHIQATSTVAIAVPETPPPSYRSRQGSATPDRNSIETSSASDTDESDYQDDVSERSRLVSATPPPFPTSESQTGVNWKYANQGMKH